MREQSDEKKKQESHVHTGDVAKGVPLILGHEKSEREREPSDNLSLGNTVYIPSIYTYLYLYYPRVLT